MRTRTRNWFAAGLIVLCAACSGGGGGDSATGVDPGPPPPGGPVDPPPPVFPNPAPYAEAEQLVATITGARLDDEDRAVVEFQLTDGRNIAITDLQLPVEYRLQKSGADWRIYDVLLEGVSLVKNYRDQFEEILARSSYQQLVADLRTKLPPGSL